MALPMILPWPVTIPMVVTVISETVMRDAIHFMTIEVSGAVQVGVTFCTAAMGFRSALPLDVKLKIYLIIIDPKSGPFSIHCRVSFDFSSADMHFKTDSSNNRKSKNRPRIE
jgi:hypothetical protein